MGGDADYAEGVAGEAGGGEDVEGCEGEGHGECYCEDVWFSEFGSVEYLVSVDRM